MRQRPSYHLTSHLGKPGKTKQRADRGKEPIKISTRDMGIKQESRGKEKQQSQELVLYKDQQNPNTFSETKRPRERSLNT